MRRLYAIAVLLLCGPAFASSYDDFSRGIDANNHGDAEAAIGYFSRSIVGGDLAPSYLPSAHLGRARAYLRDRRCNFAYADLTDAIRLRPDFVDAYSLRAEANQCLERDDAALADANAAIRLRPAAGYYFTRSRLLWNRGNFSDARADADRAAAGDPRNAYFVLWTAVTALRTGGLEPARFNALAASSGGGWPRPLIELFAGRASPQDAWRAAINSDQKCEANFYIGQWQLARGDRFSARALFQTAAAQCPRDYIAFDAAQRELRRLP
jgi:lipoprotein NlpI